METKHAPGPWEARRELGDWVIRRANVVYANDAVKIADVNHGRMDSEANAALIATSPQLLAILSAVVERTRPCHDAEGITIAPTRSQIAEARHIIAKAKLGKPITDNADGLDDKLTASLPAMVEDAQEAP